MSVSNVREKNVGAATKKFPLVVLAASTFLSGVLCAPVPVYAQSGPIPVHLDLSPLQRMTQAAYNQGIYFNLYYIGEFAANPIGGEQQGNAYNGHLRLDTALDLQKLLGIPGGSLHITFTDRSGENLSAKRIDTDAFVQQLYGSDETYIFSKFEYVQRLFQGRVEIMGGRMDLSDTFDRSHFGCDFQSDMDCGNPRALAQDINKAAFPTPVWAGVVRVKPTPNIYATAGMYQVDPNETNPLVTHGFNWGTGRSTGYTLPLEVGYEWKTPGAQAYNRYDIGTVIDKAKYTAKTPFGQYFYSPHTYRGRQVIYAQATQLVWQAQPNSKRGVYVLGNVVYGASGKKQSENFDWITNVIWRGPLAARPEDYLGFGFSGIHYNDSFLQALYQVRVKEHGTQFPNAWQFVGEINYAVQINKWLQFLPNVQWIINPNGLGYAKYTVKNVPSALVVGFQFNIGLSKLLGIPEGPKEMMNWVSN